MRNQSSWRARAAESLSAQVRGKKNLVFDRTLVGPVGIIVKVGTLQEFGVDKFFILENDNVDSSQHNVVFVARGECGRHVEAIAGTPGPSARPGRDIG